MITFYGIKYSLMLTIKYSRIVSSDLKCQNSINYFVFIKILDAFSTILTFKVYIVNGSTLTELFYIWYQNCIHEYH